MNGDNVSVVSLQIALLVLPLKLFSKCQLVITIIII